MNIVLYKLVVILELITIKKLFFSLINTFSKINTILLCVVWILENAYGIHLNTRWLLELK